MSRRKATHYGECQVCGNRQKLPGGRLSRHGYTTRWGFFSGECMGSGLLPFELSCDVLKRSRENTAAYAADLREEATSHQFSSDGPVYRPRWERDRLGRRLVWEEVDVDAITGWGDAYTIEQSARRWTTFDGRQEIKRKWGQLYDMDADTVNHKALRAYLRLAYATHLRNEAAKRDEYVAWADSRLKNWEVRELVPVDRKSTSK